MRLDKTAPPGLLRIEALTDKIVDGLIKKGHSRTEADGAVAEILKENMDELRNSKFAMVATSLKHIFREELTA